MATRSPWRPEMVRVPDTVQAPTAVEEAGKHKSNTYSTYVMFKSLSTQIPGNVMPNQSTTLKAVLKRLHVGWSLCHVD